VGYEGAFGMGFYIILLPIINFVPCTFGAEACVINDEGYPYMERPVMYFA
jgi:hypothetical protein